LHNCSFRFIDTVISEYDADGISKDIGTYYNTEMLPALKGLIPARIVKDYETGYLDVVYRLRANPFYWFIFRILCKMLKWQRK
jgi:hypothetical protein